MSRSAISHTTRVRNLFSVNFVNRNIFLNQIISDYIRKLLFHKIHQRFSQNEHWTLNTQNWKNSGEDVIYLHNINIENVRDSSMIFLLDSSKKSWFNLPKIYIITNCRVQSMTCELCYKPRRNIFSSTKIFV